MKPEPHPGAGAIGARAGDLPAAFFPEAAQSLALSQRLAELSTGAGIAFCALVANQALEGQVKFAHAFAGHARAQSRSIGTLALAVVPPGPMREALVGSASVAETLADRLAESASGYGRAFGHLAFAFPVTGRDA
jgi:hypothetical protein